MGSEGTAYQPHVNDDSSNTEGSSAFAITIFQGNKIWTWAEVDNAFLTLFEEQVQKKYQVFPHHST